LLARTFARFQRRAPRFCDSELVSVVAGYALLQCAAELPKEARDTLALIKTGGPFRYRRDGSVFGNFEKRLPARSRGYYREYTVKTPGARNRGARRIVCGVVPECYYSPDHYQTFKRIREQP